MHATQYEVTLPADYDMAIIRERVATRGPALDTLPGLGLKAYLIRERGVDGSPVNQYAPFYLWHTVAGMNAFLFGPGFAGFTASFGRPAVRQWTGLAFATGSARDAVPRSATRQVWPVPPDGDATGHVERALGEHRARALDPDVHSAALAVDTHRWELVLFTLWGPSGVDVEGTRFQVLHLSRPHLADLPVGRTW